MKKLKLLFILSFSAASAIAQRHNLLFTDSLINKYFPKFPSREVFNDSAQILTGEYKRRGENSVKVEVKCNNLSEKGIRSEFAFKPETNPERWYGVSIYAPNSYQPDPEPEIVTQWHNVPDFSLGEQWLTPSITMWVQDGHWDFHVQWDTARVTRQGKWIGHEYTNLGYVELNKWTDWVFHIKFSYKSDGIVEVFKNGVKVYTRNGPNFFNDAVLPYWKIGIYKWVYKDHAPKAHKFQNRVLYYSQIRKGDEHATYADVAP